MQNGEMESTLNTNICLYHGVDLDGFCSGAVYSRYMRARGLPYELIPANYGWKLPWEKFEDANVTLVDFSLPMNELQKLLNIAKSVMWIDHHKSAIEEFRQTTFLNLRKLNTVLTIDFAGCELIWNYLFPQDSIPYTVHLLGRYDVWRHENLDVLPFQYGMRLFDLKPDVGKDDWLWDILLDDPNSVQSDREQSIIETGRSILQYQTKEDATAAKSSCFELDWNGQKWICSNRGGKGSKFFDSLWDETKYAGMMSFGWNGSHWTFGLYSTRDDVDCGAIAKQYDGGGHKGAAGFRCDCLPFDLTDGTRVFRAS